MSEIILDGEDGEVVLRDEHGRILGPNGKPIKGPIGRAPKRMPILGGDNQSVLGEVMVYISDEMLVREPTKFPPFYQDFYLQVGWRNGWMISRGHFGQALPLGPRGLAIDALTLHPAMREVLERSTAEQIERHGRDRVPTAEEKWPKARRQ